MSRLVHGPVQPVAFPPLRQLAELAEQAADGGPEQQQAGDDHPGDEREDQAVLHRGHATVVPAKPVGDVAGGEHESS